MDIGKSFIFAFEDDRWITKLLIAAAILLVGVVFFWVALIPLIVAILLLAGYQVEITRRVIRGVTPILPEWDDWRSLLAEGVKFAAIGIVYSLPAIIVSICLMIPIGLADKAGSGDLNWVGCVFSCPLVCLNFLWAIVVALLLPAAVGLYVAKDNLAAAFRFGEVIGFVRKNPTPYVITAVLAFVASLIGSLGTSICVIGWLVTYPYSIIVTGHLYGQAYLEASGQSAALAPEATP